MNNKILGLIVFVLSLQMSRERSAVWEFYKKDSSGAAICTLCASEISQESKSNVKMPLTCGSTSKLYISFVGIVFLQSVFLKGCDFAPLFHKRL